MKKSVLFGIAALAMGVVVASLGGKKVKPSNTQGTNKPYWK